MGLNQSNTASNTLFENLSDHQGRLFSPVRTEPERYPQGPGWKGTKGNPSHEAAKAIAPKAPNLRELVLRKIIECNAEGNFPTADDVARRMMRSPFSVRPRISELHLRGELERVEERGKNESGMTASRWRATKTVGGA